MCIGLPMQVVESGFGSAICEGFGDRRRVDTLLVGEQPPGTWLLVFLGSAREVLDPDEARRIGDAVRALEAVMSGAAVRPEDIDAFFPDLAASRERSLPGGEKP